MSTPKSVRYCSRREITVPTWCRRESKAVRDDLTRKSILEFGIRQPLVLVPDADGRILLADGLLRLEIAETEGISKLPYVLDEDCPDGTAPDDYARKIRFIVNFHRQDLLPSQKAEMIVELKGRYGMSNAQVAAYLGAAPDSITNWLAVKKYIAPVVEAMDSGRLTMQAARVFDGMTDEGQKAVWRAHGRDLMSGSAGHKELRAKYAPGEYPRYYRQPELVANRLARKSGARKAVARGMSPADKTRLLKSFEVRELELREGEVELARLRREINASIAPIAAILRNEKLLALVPEAMREELRAFAESYV